MEPMDPDEVLFLRGFPEMHLMSLPCRFPEQLRLDRTEDVDGIGVSKRSKSPQSLH